MQSLLGALFKTIVIRFASNVFVHFAGFEGEYYVYLTEKRVKWAERGDAKVVAIVLNKAPSASSGKDLKYDAGLFAARRRGRALKGSQAFLRLFHAAWEQ